MKKTLFALVALIIAVMQVTAQKAGKEAVVTPEGYKFTTVVTLPASPVKNQAATGTCWCFATTSFMESELLRLGKGEYDLSEMFVVRKTYENRVRDNYLRQGKGNLGPGSLSPSWIRIFNESGIVPEEVYNGISYSSPVHNHGELQSYIEAVTAIPVKKKSVSKESDEVVSAVLDIYLGDVPENFTYKEQTYTAKSFAASLGLDMNNYVNITSFSHFPFYTEGLLEVPDNWEMNRFYNVPLDQLISIIDNSFAKGYTIVWDGDVSEKGFSHSKGVAVVPDVVHFDSYSATDRARFEKMPEQERMAEVYKFEKPYPEVNVTQEIRQKGYEAFVTTDDHLMHLTGMVKDQNGTKYYITKNSWGTDRNPFGGYLNMSESYVRAKTIYILVHKDAVPADIRGKLGF
ncbi:MAG: C1 family peptidase [Bacteroidales bacterium]|nr:C1 family peptidase [Bacteroidales bacterium]